MPKIYELENRFVEAFNNAIEAIDFYAEKGKPMTLGDVLDYGFNNVIINGKRGYLPEDFPEEELSLKVTYLDHETDGDGFKAVYLEEVA